MTSNRVTDICQLANNELWISTQNGINSYDGLIWKSISDSTVNPSSSGLVTLRSLPDTSLVLLSVDNRSISISKFHDNKWAKIDSPPGLHYSTVYSTFILATTKDKMVAGTGNDLFFRKGQAWEKINFDPDSPKINTAQFLGDSLFCCSNQGLYVLYHNKIERYYPNETIYNIIWAEECQMWFLLGANWVAQTPSLGQPLTILDHRKIGLGHSHSYSNLLYYNKCLYYSFNSPLYQYNLDRHTVVSITNQNFDQDYTCTKALFDHENNLWYSSTRGLFKINNLNLYGYNGNQLLENEVSAVLQSPNEDLFLGTNTGLNIIRKSGKIEKYLFPEHFIRPRSMDMILFQGELYIAANTAGVAHFTGNKLEYDTINGLGNRVIDLEVYQNQLYATSRGMLLRKNGENWEIVVNLTDSIGVIRKILLNDKYQLLLTRSGVYNLKTGNLISSGDIKTDNLFSAETYHDTLFLGAINGVKALIDNQIVTPKWATESNLSVYAFLQDAKHRLWVGTEQGIYAVRHKNDLKLNNTNGLIGNEINRNAFVILKDSSIAIGTDEGLSIYHPPSVFNQPVPVPEILLPIVNRQPLTRWPTQLGHLNNNIRFYFRTVSFFNEELINYRVKLEGQESIWQEIPYSTQRSLLYVNLDPGTYQLLVQSRIGNGPWSPVVKSPKFEITPAYYDSFLFKISCALFFIIILLLIIRLRIRRLRERNALLRSRIEEKTGELNSQNQELLKAITNLKTTQTQLIQSEKLASMGHLTAGLAHELNNPLNYMRGGAECILKNLEELEVLLNSLRIWKNHADQAREYRYIMEDCRQLAESILHGASKSTSIVKSLSSFTADAQNFFSFIDLEKEIDTALTLLSNEIGFRITINRLFGNVPPLECYPAKINQLLVNILLNAIQAIRDTGEITIRVYRKDVTRIGMEIIDNGDGLKIENTEQVFEPFYTTKDTNPGLGLTIVKSIVQEHNGYIALSPRPGSGTKVTVLLPINQTAHPERVEE